MPAAHAAPHLITDLAVILITAAVVAWAFDRLKQSVVMGYILAGVLIGPHGPLPWVTDVASLSSWGELGVIFLMFHLGLELNLRRLRRQGAMLVAVGVLEVAALGGLGWLIARSLGYDGLDPIFLASMLAISSTTVIVKALDEAGLKTKGFAERVYGLLVIEDLLAVLMLVALTSLVDGDRPFDTSKLAYFLLELLVVIGGWFVILGLIVPRVVRKVGISKRDELLTLLASGLCLVLAVAASSFQYSAALGAFIMGTIVSEAPESERIHKLILPLRDLFAAVFFVTVGMLCDPATLIVHWPIILALTAFVIVGKTLAITGASLFAGIRLTTSLRMALAMGQIGEFTFILAGLGLASGKMSEELQPIVIAVAILTAFTTPHLIAKSERFARWLESKLPAPIAARLERYTLQASTLGEGRVLVSWLRPGWGRWILNSFLVALIFGAVRKYLTPFLAVQIENPLGAQVGGLTVAILFSGPFVYGMLTAARRLGANAPKLTAPQRWVRTLVFLFVTILVLGILSAQFISVFASIVVSGAFALMLIGFFFRRMASSYEWLEGQFLSGLRQPEGPSEDLFKRFTPWDARLSHVSVHPNSIVAGLSLRASRLREEHGLSVVAIRRGESVMVTPRPEELVLPHDELLVLGTEEQTERARVAIETAALISTGSRLEDYELHALRVDANSRLLGRTVRDCGLRDQHGAIIAGVEREQKRILNPAPDFDFRLGDLIWLVGPRDAGLLL